MKKVFFGNTGSNVSSSATRYFSPSVSPGIQTTEAPSIVPTSGTIRNLRLKLSGSPGTGKSYTFTLRKNGSDTALTTTISDSQTDASDEANEVSVSPGDLISVSVAPTGTPTARAVAYSIEFESTGNLSYNSSITGGLYSSTYFALAGFSTGGTLALSEVVASHDSTIKSIYVSMDTAPGGGGSHTFSVYKNGSEEATSVFTVTGANTTGSVTGLSIDVAPGDTLAIRYIRNSSPTYAGMCTFSIVFEGDNDGQSHIFGYPSDAVYQGFLVNYSHPQGLFYAVSSSLIFNFRHLAGVTPFTLKNLAVKLIPAPGSGDSLITHVRKNGVATDLEVSISDSDVYGINTSDEVIIENGDLIEMAVIGVNTPEYSYGMLGMTQEITDGTDISAEVNIRAQGESNPSERGFILVADDQATGEVNLVTQGKTDGSSERELITSGKLLTSSTMDFYVVGKDTDTDERDFVGTGALGANDSRSFKTRGRDLLALGETVVVSEDEILHVTSSESETESVAVADSVSVSYSRGLQINGIPMPYPHDLHIRKSEQKEEHVTLTGNRKYDVTQVIRSFEMEYRYADFTKAVWEQVMTIYEQQVDDGVDLAAYIIWDEESIDSYCMLDFSPVEYIAGTDRLVRFRLIITELQ